MDTLNQSANAPLDNRCASDGAGKALVRVGDSQPRPVLLSEPTCPVDAPIPSEGRNPLPFPSDASTALHEGRAHAIWQHLKALKR